MIVKRKSDDILNQPNNKKLSYTCSVKKLPAEILTIVFSFFSFKELSQASLVCWDWHGIAHQEQLWKARCLEIELSEKKEGKTWKQLACEQAKWAIFFVKGDILLREPQLTSSTSRADAPFSMGEIRRISSCENKNFKVERQIVGNFERTCLKITCLIEPSGTVSLDIDGLVFCMALQENILGAFGRFEVYEGKMGLLLINLNDQSTRLYPYTGPSHFNEKDGKLSLNVFCARWQEFILQILYDSQRKDFPAFVMNFWDFSHGPVLANDTMENEKN